MRISIWCVVLSLLIGGVSARAESGIASFYGGKHHGGPTASGERYNQNSMTCAHRTARFGTRLTVTYRGRSIECRVNDRGPFIRGRIVDVSTSAARALGMIDAGLVRVVIEVVDDTKEAVKENVTRGVAEVVREVKDEIVKEARNDEPPEFFAPL
jgi:rare lipoprotein A